jgi:hypothetical protein
MSDPDLISMAPRRIAGAPAVATGVGDVKVPVGVTVAGGAAVGDVVRTTEVSGPVGPVPAEVEESEAPVAPDVCDSVELVSSDVTEVLPVSAEVTVGGVESVGAAEEPGGIDWAVVVDAGGAPVIVGSPPVVLA